MLSAFLLMSCSAICLSNLRQFLPHLGFQFLSHFCYYALLYRLSVCLHCTWFFCSVCNYCHQAIYFACQFWDIFMYFHIFQNERQILIIQHYFRGSFPYFGGVKDYKSYNLYVFTLELYFSRDVLSVKYNIPTFCALYSL